MAHLIQASVLLAAELAVFYLAGGLLPFGRKPGERFAAETICAGYLLYSALFEIVCLLCAAAGTSLTRFSCVWAACVSSLIAVAAVSRPRTRFLAELPEDIRSHRIHPLCAMMTAAVAAAAVYAALRPAVDDSAMTVGRMASNYVHDSIGRYDPVTGEPLTGLPLGTFLALRYVHGDYISLLSGLPVKASAKYFAVMRNVVLSFLLIYRVLARLLKKRSAAAAVVLLLIGVSVFLRFRRFTSFMLFEQGWTGDAELAGVLIPALVLTALLTARGGDADRLFALAFLEGVTALSLSPASVAAFPFLEAALLIPAVIRSRKWSSFLRLLLCVLIPAMAAWLVISSNPQIPFR